MTGRPSNFLVSVSKYHVIFSESRVRVIIKLFGIFAAFSGPTGISVQIGRRLHHKEYKTMQRIATSHD